MPSLNLLTKPVQQAEPRLHLTSGIGNGHRLSALQLPDATAHLLHFITLEETQTRQPFQNTFDQLVISGNFTLSLCTFED
jgi:hypothetical protein